MPHKLVLTENLPAIGMQALSERSGVDVVVLSEPSTTALSTAISDADGVIMVLERPALTGAIIENARMLRVACRFGAGYDNLDVSALTRRGIPLVTTADANADTVAEHALYLMLALAKRGPFLDRAVKAGIWKRSFGGVELRGKTCVIVGYGRIGRRIAALANAFAMSIEIVDPAADGNEILQSGYAHTKQLGDALSRADFLVLACAYNSSTKGLIGAPALKMLKEDCVSDQCFTGPCGRRTRADHGTRKRPLGRRGS